MKNIFKKIVVRLLRAEAKLVLRKYKPKIVAVTGSVGKTSAKDAIYAVLAETAHVRKSEKSFNSEIGLPLTILGLSNAWNNPLKWLRNLLDGLAVILFSSKYPGVYPEWLVLEVGADRPGDIKSLRRWLKTDVVVITRLPEVPVHVEFFRSAEEVVEEKASLMNTLRKDGTVVLYGDEENVRALRQHPKATRVITYGLHHHNDVRAENTALLQETVREGKIIEWPLGMRATLATQSATMPIELVGAVGTHALLPLVAAAAVGEALRLEHTDVAKGLMQYKPPPGRMHLVPGVKETLVIDDTYNSSPAACMAALDALDLVPHQGSRKIVVLGDMLELGKHSAAEHRKVGARAAKTANLLVTVGFRARDIANGALDQGMPDGNILQYEGSDTAGKELQNIIKEGDLVLVKGSQSMRMERVVEELMKTPERAVDELVRQDSYWRYR